MEFTTILDSRKSIRTYTGEPISEGFTPTCSITLGKTEETYAPRDGRDDRIGMNCI